MSGDWYLPILNEMDPEELEALKEFVLLPENDQMRSRLSLYCDTREEMAIVAKRFCGLKFRKDAAEGEPKFDYE